MADGQGLRKIRQKIDLPAAVIYAALLLLFYFAGKAWLMPFKSMAWFLQGFYPIFVLAIFLPALFRRKRVSRLGVLGALLGLLLAELAERTAVCRRAWYLSRGFVIFAVVFAASLLLGLLVDEKLKTFEREQSGEK